MMDEAARRVKNAYQREYRRKNKERDLEHNREYQREWRRRNKDKVREYNARYWAKKASEGE